jgi:hypothetical protein
VRQDDTRRLYREFAAREARGRSPLYERLALGVAADADLAHLLDRVPPSKRQPNLLFATVRFLGGMGTDFASFRLFVLDRRDEVADLLIRRRTQTNEVGRCAIQRGEGSDSMSLARWGYELYGGFVLSDASLRQMTDFRGEWGRAGGHRLLAGSTGRARL